MNEIEKNLQHEMIKNIMKKAIDNNPYLSPIQKEQEKARVDICAVQADKIENLLSMINYLGL